MDSSQDCPHAIAGSAHELITLTLTSGMSMYWPWDYPQSGCRLVLQSSCNTPLHLLPFLQQEGAVVLG